MTDSDRSKTEYPEGVELTTAMLCKDGQYRSDCVVVVDRGGRMGHEPICGQPIIGIIHAGNVMGDIRMCQEHLDSAVQWMVPPGTPPDATATALLKRLRSKGNKT